METPGEVSLGKVKVMWVGSELPRFVPPDLDITLCATFDDVLLASDSPSASKSAVHASWHLRHELSQLVSKLSDTERALLKTVSTVFTQDCEPFLQQSTCWCLLVMMLDYLNWQWDGQLHDQFVS